MHGQLLLATALFACLLLVATGTDAASNTTSTSSNGIHAIAQPRTCVQPSNAVNGWYYYSHKFYAKTKLTHTCKGRPGHEWSMLNAYVDGGKEGINWKHTKDPNDPACMNNWVYYDRDRVTVIATIQGRTTTLNDRKKKLWCALPAYQADGIQGKQWEYCSCTGAVDPVIPPSAGETCSRPAESVSNWVFDLRVDRSPKNCTTKDDDEGKMWTMLNAYQSGGQVNKHWKYTVMSDFDNCMEDWTYYAKDGVTKIADIKGSVTKRGESKEWCPLKVARNTKASLGKTWTYCSCP